VSLRRRATILMYHAVGTLGDDPNLLATSPERFEAHMRYLKRRNLRGVSVRELLRAVNSGTPKGLVGLTFDDGYEDFLSTAVPVLERFGFSATVFVVAGMLGQENDWVHAYSPRPRLKLLGAKDLRETTARGMEVGSHGMTHANLLGTEPELLEEEVSGSRRLLGEALGEEVAGFCYPYGSYNAATVQAVRQAGYLYACALTERVERSVYDLPRIPVTERDNILRFEAKLDFFPQFRAAKRAKKTLQRLAGLVPS
jgi:peptidoglycan/xylan/chitin deacetylase (PgdA/CDA1 family)